MGLGGDTDIAIRITVDETGAVRSFQQIGQAFENVQKAAPKVESGFSGIQRSVITLNQGLQLLRQGFSAANTAFQALQQGDKVDDLAQGFRELTQAAGAVSDTFLGQLKQATGGLVTQFELMRTANKALQAGLSPETFLNIAGAAKQYADRVGIDAVPAIEKFTQAITRGSKFQLEQLGLLRDGKVAIEQFNPALATQVINQQNAAEAAQVFANQLQDAKDQALQALATNETLAQVIRDLGEAIKGLDFKLMIEGFSQITAGAVIAAKAVGDFFANDVFTRFAKQSTPVIAEFEKRLDRIVKLLEGGTKEAVQQATKEFNNFISVVNDNALVRTALGEGIGNVQAQIIDLREQLGLTTDVQGDNTKITKSQTTALDNLRKTYKEITDEVGKFKKGQEKNAIETPILLDARRIDLGGDSSNLKDELAQGIATALAGAIQTLGKAIFSGGAGDIQSALGSLAGGLGAGLGKELLGETFEKAINENIGTVFGVSLGSAGGPIAAAVGQVVGEGLVEGVGSAFKKAFGGRDAQGAARDSVDKFLEEVFDAEKLRLVIDGQFRDVFSVDFLRDGDAFSLGTFDDAFAQIPVAAQSAFGAAGVYLQDFLNLNEDISGQIAAVLSNNIGGSLNNLGIVLGTLGVSAEDVGKSIQQSFDRGALSALEAYGQITNIQRVFEKGIPDAVGAVDQAFGNVFAAGAKGGRVLSDAIVDVAAEFQELGGKDLAGLQVKLNEFVAAGQFSAEQVNAFFKGLSEQGITTLDQAINATSQQLLGIGAALQASGVLEVIDGVVESILSLPDEKTVRINVETQFTGNPAAQKAAFGDQLPGGGTSSRA